MICNSAWCKDGSISNFATGFQKFHLSWEESILQLYIFIWNMKSKVLDSQQWWSSIIIINLCSCNGLLASEGPDRRVYASEFELLNKLWWWSYIVNVRHIWWTSVMYDRRHILWMSIINEYDGCPSFINMMNVHHLWMRWMSIIYDVCMYWILDASHICMMDVHHIWCITVINVHHVNVLCDGTNGTF